MLILSTLRDNLALKLSPDIQTCAYSIKPAPSKDMIEGTAMAIRGENKRIKGDLLVRVLAPNELHRVSGVPNLKMEQSRRTDIKATVLYTPGRGEELPGPPSNCSSESKLLFKAIVTGAQDLIRERIARVLRLTHEA